MTISRADSVVPARWTVCAYGSLAVAYPTDWYASEDCRLFDAQPFEVPANSDFYGTALTVSIEPGDALAGWEDEQFWIMHSRGRFDGWVRLDVESTGRGLFDRGTRLEVFLRDRVVVQAIDEGRAVAERVVRALQIVEEPEHEPVAVGAEGVVPAAVERTRVAILAAVDARDYDALRELVPPEFSYTFGGPFEGGPVAYWQNLEQTTDDDPFGALAAVLRMPYTLYRGTYVWPFAYDRTPDELSAYERELLGPFADDFLGDGYLGWRAGIEPDGTWRFFIAGD